jgi:hypothetical protein
MRSVFLLLLVAFSCLGHAQAQLSIVPAISEFRPDGGVHRGSVAVLNPRPTPIAFEMSVFERVFGEGGGEELVDVSAEFAILPPLGTIAPGESQVVRIQLMGPPVTDQSRSFRLYATEVLAPLSEEEAVEMGTGVRVRERFGASMHLVPAGAEAAISVDRVSEPRVVEEQGRVVDVTLTNSGNRFVYPFELRIDVDGRTLTNEELQKIALPRPIGPGATETLAIPLLESAVGNSVPEITVSLGDARR